MAGIKKSYERRAIVRSVAPSVFHLTEVLAKTGRIAPGATVPSTACKRREKACVSRGGRPHYGENIGRRARLVV